MRGEIADFSESLRRRVQLLKGAPEAALGDVYRQRLRLNPGASELVDALQAAGIATLLVSGGFTFFAERVQATLRLEHAAANVLEVRNGVLTGHLLGPIVDGEEKKRQLLQMCERVACSPAQAIAVGDGANDLPMMGAAGLSVAYHAKPKVRAQAMVAIDSGGLDRLLEIVN